MNKNLLINNWRNCLIEIEKHISKEEFMKWIQPISVGSFDGQTLQLLVPAREYAEHIDKFFLPSIRPIIQKSFEGIRSLKYVSSLASETKSGLSAQTPAFTNQTNTQQIVKNPFEAQGIRKMVIDPQLNFDYCFDNYIGGECNKLARVAGVAVAANPGDMSLNPFFVHGNSGLGKTHLVQAIGIEIKKNNPDLNVLYVSANRFLDQYTTAARRKEVGNFVLFYQCIDVLIIDDIQEFAGRPGTQVVLFNIFNHLRMNGKQLVFTCDKSPTELTDIEQRLITRFKGGITAQITAPDFDTKVRIIHSKADKLHLTLPKDVVDYMAKHITASVREIEGVISSFAAYSSLLDKAPSMELARNILKAYVNNDEKSNAKSAEVTVDMIQQSVCSFYNVSKEDFYSSKRHKAIAQSRQVAMYLCKQMTGLSLKAIGLAIGGKTHATVIHAEKTINNLLETSKEFGLELEQIKQMFVK